MKYIRTLLLNASSYQVIKLIHPCYNLSALRKRLSFQTSKVEETHGTMIVIIHITNNFILRKCYGQVGHI